KVKNGAIHFAFLKSGREFQQFSVNRSRHESLVLKIACRTNRLLWKLVTLKAGCLENRLSLSNQST
ncbi:MAG TPA: hypothetical protein DIU11_20365, partial [Pusillimonas sp.]|nr:hypothetical protein [Pusillimonas sp.]